MTARARRRLTSIGLPARLPPVALLALGGCDVALGLDLGPDDNRVRVELVRRGVRNDAAGAPVLDSAPYRLPVEVITLADGTSPTVTSDAGGFLTFTRSAPDQGYRVEVGDGAERSEVQSAAANLRFGVPEFGRLDRVAPTTSPSISLVIEGALPASTIDVVTTGVWTRSGFDPVGGQLDWATAGAFTAPAGLLQATAGDRGYAVRHDPQGDATAPFTALAAACELAPALEMTSGASLTAGCSLAPLPLEQCVRVEAPLAVENARLLGAIGEPDLYTQTGSAWALTAAPAPSLSPRAGFQLAAASAIPARDWSLDVRHANPFPGHAVRLTSASSQVRAVTREGASATNLAAFTFETETPAPDCSTPSRIGGTTAIPGAFVLDGTALVEGASLAPTPVPRVTLRWGDMAAGDVDYYVAFLVEVTTTTTAGVLVTTLVPRRRYVTSTPSADVETALLEPDHAYVIGVLALRGVPGAADGDFDTHDAGSDGGALAYSGVFTIAR